METLPFETHRQSRRKAYVGTDTLFRKKRVNFSFETTRIAYSNQERRLAVTDPIICNIVKEYGSKRET